MPISLDSKSAPQPPLVLEVDNTTVNQKLKRIREHTALHEFRFGSSDYDRWAVVYGRIESDGEAPKRDAAAAENPSPPRVLIHGEGAIIFINDE